MEGSQEALQQHEEELDGRWDQDILGLPRWGTHQD